MNDDVTKNMDALEAAIRLMNEKVSKVHGLDSDTVAPFKGLVIMAVMARMLAGPERAGWRHTSFEELVLCEGAIMPEVAASLPAGVKKGRLGQCFKTAFHATDDGEADGLTYCEGYGILEGLPVGHAWVAPKAGPQMFDPTWGSRPVWRTVHYIGIPFTQSFVRECVVATGFYGLLGAVSRESAMLTRGWLQHGLPAHAVCEQSLANCREACILMGQKIKPTKRRS